MELTDKEKRDMVQLLQEDKDLILALQVQDGIRKLELFEKLIKELNIEKQN